MKTANVATMKAVSVNPALNPQNGLKMNPASRLSIQGYELREWLDRLTGSNGLYFLDMDIDKNNYSMHFQHHVSGKLLELDCQEEMKEFEDPRKEFLEALIFDLSLFPEEPILAFDSDQVEKQLRNLAAIYYEHAITIDNIISRLMNLDLKKLFELGIYKDSRVREISLDGVYQALYPGTSRTFNKEHGSYGMYLIFLAVESVFYQVIGEKTMA